MYLDHLNPPQREAVLHTEGPLLIFAGAGSGKTRVLVQRIAHLIEHCGASPWNIFSVTFTNKAAGEMRERVRQLMGYRADEVWISTFHSAGVKILRRHIEALGYGSSFVIYDDSDQISILKECLEELQINPKIFTPRAIQSKIDAAKNELVEPGNYPSGDFFGERVAEVYQLYSKKLLKNNALDFGDLLRLPVRLFEGFPHILEEYANRLRYLMVDEYQDTNHAQYRLIKLLASKHKNLCVVGDDDQSIYRWRGADIRNILDFEKDFPGAAVIKLEQNYRSTQTILDAASKVVEKIAERQSKKIWTQNSSGELLTWFQGLSDRDESAFVVQQIRQLQSQGTALSDMAIFYRTNAQSRLFEDELRKYNIPYVIYGGVRFYDRQEVKDILAYLWVLNNNLDDFHLKRIVNVPTRGIGKTTLEKFEQYAALNQIPLRQALNEASALGLPAKVVEKIRRFTMLLENLEALQKGHDASDNSDAKISNFVREVIERTGYLEALKAEATLEAEGRIENLEELINVVQDYERSTPTPQLQGFLDQVALVQEVSTEEDQRRALPLMTLHLAKGLEFEVVFLVGLEEGLLPHSRSIDAPAELDEERRLTYVGMTRAKRKLFISNVERRRLYGQDQYHLPSRFLDDIPSQCVEIRRPDPESWSSMRSGSSNFSRQGMGSSSKKIWIPESNSKLSLSGPVASPPDTKNPYRAGVKVRHPVFGDGTIQHSEGDAEHRKIIVSFLRVGTKKLVASLSNLTILG